MTRYCIVRPDGAVIAESEFSSVAWARAISRGDTDGCCELMFDDRKQTVRDGRVVSIEQEQGR